MNTSIIRKNLNEKDRAYFEIYVKNGSFRERVFNALYQLKQIARIKGQYQIEKAVESFISVQR